MSPNPYESPLVEATLAGPPTGPVWEEVEVEYELTIDDYVAFNLHHLRRSPAQRKLRVWVILMGMVLGQLLIALLMLQSAFDPRSARSLSVAGPVMMGITLLVFGFWALRTWRAGSSPWLVKRMVRSMLTQGDSSAILGKRRLRVTSKVIEEIADLRETRWKLQCVQQINVTPHYAFVYLAPIIAIIVPARVFASREHFATFIANIEEHTGRSAERFPV
jgi:hypothetical protein